jgi:FkbM family methyltransferase
MAMGEVEGMTEVLLREVRDELRALKKAMIFNSLDEFATVDIWFDNTKIKLFVPDAITDRIQGHVLMTRRFFEEQNLTKVRKFVYPSSVVCDVGANMGNHSIFFSKICDAQRVYSFEPQRRLFEIIQNNYALNNIDNQRFEVVNSGCGSIDGFIEIQRSVNHNLGATQFKHSDDGSFRLLALDSLRLERLDFLKIDVERMGDSVLEGARETIGRCRPVIWIELYDDEEVRARPILDQLGYIQSEKLSNSDFIFSPKDL